MVKVIRTVSGDEVLVDDAFYEALSMKKWYSIAGGRTKYARAYHKGEHIYMHRLIMEAPEGMVIDHLDCNGLNNQRENLEVVTPAENSRRVTPFRARQAYDDWKRLDDEILHSNVKGPNRPEGLSSQTLVNTRKDGSGGGT